MTNVPKSGRSVSLVLPRLRATGVILRAVALAVLCVGQVTAPATRAAESRESFARIRPTVERSVVMVKVAAFPQARVKGVIQPPRQFDLEGPATVVGPGVIVGSLSVFDPSKGFPPREGLEFGTTVYSKVEILVDGADWIEGRMSAMADSEDLIFFAPAKTEDAARLPALAAITEPRVVVFAEYLEVTRAPAAFGRCAIARLSTISGVVPDGAYLFVTAQSAGSPVVDADGAMLGLGVRVASPGLAATSALLPAERVLAIAREKGLLVAAP